MIGNVWELVQGEVIDGKLGDEVLPAAGYIVAVNDNGIPTETKNVASTLYGSDYFWAEASGTYAVMRGGFYKGHHDAGLYSIQAAIAEDFAGEAVGFRCMLAL
jgi:formylglycine-generating enzyme required for sulfatase activity